VAVGVGAVLLRSPVPALTQPLLAVAVALGVFAVTYYALQQIITALRRRRR